MAVQTGGLTVQNTNDLSAGLGRVLNDLRGYYLIGYEPPPGGADWENAPVSVRVKRKDLSIRSRQGPFGPATRSAAATPIIADPLVAALLSPFSASALPVRINAWFARRGGMGYRLRSDLFFEGSDLPLTKRADGHYAADLEIGEVIVGDNGVLPATSRRALSLDLTEDEYHSLRSSSLVYTLPLTLKEPGVYQIRIAVRDVHTGAVGSATQVMVVPKVGKGRLAMSGVVLGSSRNRVVDAGAPSEDAASHEVTLPSGVFRRGTPIAYAFLVYNGIGGSGDDGLVTRIAVLQNGRAIATADPQPVRRLAPKDGVAVIPIVGSLNIAHLGAGKYALEVTVTDRRCKCATTQTVDMELQ
jgi:hypothetical protein